MPDTIQTTLALTSIGYRRFSNKKATVWARSWVDLNEWAMNALECNTLWSSLYGIPPCNLDGAFAETPMQPFTDQDIVILEEKASAERTEV